MCQMGIGGGGWDAKEKKEYLEKYRENSLLINLLAKVPGAESQIARCIGVKKKILDDILAVKDNTEKTILIMRYIDGDSLREVSHRMNYSYDHIKKLHSKALMNFKRIKDDKDEVTN